LSIDDLGRRAHAAALRPASSRSRSVTMRRPPISRASSSDGTQAQSATTLRNLRDAASSSLSRWTRGRSWPKAW
jgi:hypothetical protein